MESNPYASPSANLHGPSIMGSQEAVAASTIEQLKRTKPWVRLISVLLGIGAALTLLSAVVMLVGGSVFFTTGKAARNNYFIVFGAGMYLVVGLLYLYPARRLGFYARNIRKLMESNSPVDLEAALKEQRGFWKFTGIMMIIMLSIWLLAILSSILISGPALLRH